MVLLLSSTARSAARTLRPATLRSTRALSTTSTHASSPSSTSALRAAASASSRLAGGLPTSPMLRSNLGLGPSTTIRTLTGKREKVKVLLVLYDGGHHAEERKKKKWRQRGGELGKLSELWWSCSVRAVKNCGVKPAEKAAAAGKMQIPVLIHDGNCFAKQIR
ncbi:hypothetical protein NKR23_g7997 [Pleurostoma richardsiae]|uniref:Uncharacterized protein n=1 Tax=Pleurostoma richardsiae TaxID=41990 RepID=A0AA38RKM6_9PEZI|nr:hypothetical protein NKR23_g7997 [Pleurostoma richardsiae]